MLLLDDAALAALGKKAAGALVGSAVRKLKKKLQQPEREAALESCATAGVAALVAAAEAETPEREQVLADVLEQFFSHQDLGRELQRLLQAESLDTDSLLELFAEAGYDEATLPGLDLRQGLEKFETAFLQAAAQQTALQGEITVHLSRTQVGLLEEILEEIRTRLPEAASGLVATLLPLLAARALGSEPLREAYLHRLLDTLHHLPLSGIDPEAAQRERGSTEVELATVYTALLTRRPEELEGADLLRPKREPGRRALSALEVLDREKRLVLLGDPGSGKTTFVRFVALCLAGERLSHPEANLARLTAPLPAEGKDKEPRPQPWRHGALLPVHVVLRDLAARGLGKPGEAADGDTLWRFVATELGETLGDFAAALKEELLERGGLVLLDGLDEVPEAGERREQVKAAVMGFAATFPKCRFLVTSRTYAYQRQDWKLPGFAEALLAEFEPWQVRLFIDGWYEHVGRLRGLSREEAKGGAALLKSAVAGSRRLAELATRPLLLTLMASLHAWRGGSLPEKREELYADSVDLLLGQWESPKVVKDREGRPLVVQPSLAQWLRVDRDVVRRELNRLAFEAHRDQPNLEGTADIREDQLVESLLGVARRHDANPLELVDFLSQRSGLLAARGAGVYAFPHRTFQEYLAACYLTDTRFPYLVAELGRKDPARWREAVLLAGAKAARGSAANTWMLADALSPENPSGSAGEEAWGVRLAGEVLVETADLAAVEAADRGKLERVRLRQVEVLTGSALPALERAGAGRVLANLGEPREGVLTVAGIEMCRVPAGSFLWQKGEERSVGYPYRISRFAVTQAQYGEFVESGAYGEKRFWGEAMKAGVWNAGKITDYWESVSDGRHLDFGEPFSLPNHPVVGVTWYEALAFTRWLTERLQGEGLSKGWAVRLPSEEEWEKAARGGLEVPAGEPDLGRLADLAGSAGRLSGGSSRLAKNASPRREYPWGREEISPEHANYDDTGIGGTSAVGGFPRGCSPYGCEELAGNVWEWCRNLRRGEPTDSRADAALRGGSWAGPAQHLAAAIRGRNWLGLRSQNIGFRCVLSSVSEHD